MPQVGKISSCGDNLSFLSFTALLVIRFPLIYITFKLFIIHCRGYTKSSTFIGTQFGINKPFLYFALTIYMWSKKMYLMNPYLILKHYTTLLVFIRGCSSISRSLRREGGICQMITLDHRGEGGSRKGPNMISRYLNSP